MQGQDNVDLLHRAIDALNSKDNKNQYFDLHDDSLVTHGLPGNFPPNKEGMKKFYGEVFTAFPDANFIFEHMVIQENEAACMFSLVGTHKAEFMGVPPNNKQVKINGMIFFRFESRKIVERWEVIDLLSIVKQLDVRQQLSAVRNAMFEYAEIRANKELKEKINHLFGKHLPTE